MWIHTTYISNLSYCNHTTPSICSEYMDIQQSNISQLTWRLYLGHTDITISAYTHGHRNPGGISIRHSLNTSDYPKGILFIACMLIIFEEGFQALGELYATHRMPRIHSECHIMIFSTHFYPCTRRIWTTSSESYIYLQCFANNLPNAFTHGVLCLSFLLCQKEVPF
jgi:hypothetical protein